jgi:type I restriction enzyme S subunit
MSREMKQSGVPWLKDIPSEWKVERGKNVLVLQKRPVRDNDEVVTCFRDGEVILRSLRRTEGFTMSDKEIGYQGINEGDIVIHGMDGFAGAMGVSKSTGKGSPVLVVCSPKYDAIPQYIIYYLRALAMTDVFIALATGIRERSCDLRWNKISELEFILPSAKEQQKIASFLDRKCSEIDEMIGLQEKIVEELKAYKQSVITETVTKGLNPDVPMKDSGIEWIGNIPEHYICSKLKYYVKIDSGDAISNEIIRSEGTYPVYGGGEIMGYHTESNTSKESLVIGRVGARCGCVTMPNTNCWATDNALVLKTEMKLRFMYYLLIGINLNRLNTSNAQPLITATKVKNEHIPLPPICEQEQIAKYLDTKCTEIDNLISIKQSKIDSLKEYKKSIIYEYVTGKKEV